MGEASAVKLWLKFGPVLPDSERMSLILFRCQLKVLTSGQEKSGLTWTDISGYRFGELQKRAPC